MDFLQTEEGFTRVNPRFILYVSEYVEFIQTTMLLLPPSFLVAPHSSPLIPYLPLLMLELTSFYFLFLLLVVINEFELKVYFSISKYDVCIYPFENNSAVNIKCKDSLI